MDLAIYISELLGERGDLKIPGVGHFAQTRVDGYYSDTEHTFYPPGHKINFDAAAIDQDDTLAGYIANKKNISLQSAKYFVDKYLLALKQEVLQHEVHIADLGSLSAEDSKIIFKPANTLTETDFYGLKPIIINQAGQQSIATEQPATEVISPVSVPSEIVYNPPVALQEEILTDQPVSKPQVFSPHEEEQQQLQYMEQEINKPNTLVIVLFIVTIAALVLFAVYLYNPDMFGAKSDATTIVKPVDNPKQKPVSAGTDTSKKNINGQAAVPPANTPTAPLATVVDTMNKLHYEMMGGAFKTLSKTNLAIKIYESLGLKPRILTHTTGKLYKITLGTYFIHNEAVKARDSILKATKLKKTSISIDPINPKK